MKRISDLEKKYVLEVLDTGFRSSKSSIMMQRLENEFAKKINKKYAISFINGTETMHAVLEAIGIGQGDEVIVPPLTMASTTFAVIQTGATPVFADVKEESFLIDPKNIEKNITSRTKAVIPVSLYGMMPEMDKVMDIANKYNLFVLEDDAECIGASYKGISVGGYGDASSFSFQSSKHLSSGEGGMVVTDDIELAEKIRRISSLGYAGVNAGKGKITKNDIQDPEYNRHVSMGWNYRMPELCAAVALAQVERMDELIDIRIQSGYKYLEILKNCSWLKPQNSVDATNSYWTFSVMIDRDDIGYREFRNKYLEFGGDNIYAAWKLTYLEPMFQNMMLLGREKQFTRNKDYYTDGLCPVAEKLQPRILQFKTNYWEEEYFLKQIEALKATIKFFE